MPKKIATKHTNTWQHRVVNRAHFKVLQEHAYRIINQLILLVFCMNVFQKHNPRIECVFNLKF